MIREYKFYELIQEFIIEVPIIQRDFAQGREIPNVTYIREKFVSDLVARIVNSAPLHLGFVYGKIEGKDKIKKMLLHKKAVETLLGTVKQYANQFQIDVKTDVTAEEISLDNTLRFIPLDGQQRLTTLFVLYWYINMRKNGHSPKWVSNFKYNNRKSAVAFFETIGNQEVIASVHADLQPNLKDQIQGYTWYLKKWDYDATVSGILVMLQTIHDEFKLYPDFNFKTTNLDKINFTLDFLDLDELEQTDELYIKMNERGKLLTDFEHFKAWLQDYTAKKYTSEDQKNFLKDFWIKLDTVWLDFFWKNINSNYTTLDDFFFNYLKTMAVTYHLANYKDNEIPEFLKSLMQEIRNGDKYEKDKVRYIPISKFVYHIKSDNEEIEVFELFSFEALEFIENSFNSLIRFNSDEIIYNSIQEVLKHPFVSHNITESYLKKEKFTLDYWDHVMYFALIEYNIKSNIIEGNHFKNWLRILRNIIYNTQIQNPENLYNALHSVKEITNNYLNEDVLLNEIIQTEDFQIRFFSPSQLGEEKYKAELIRDSQWKIEVEVLENHSYFYGQIGFIFKLITSEDGDPNIDLFREYGKILSSLFEKDTEEFLLQRALLAIEDYLIQVNNNFSFCRTDTDSLRSRNENWRKVFNDDKRLNIIKQLINLISISEETSFQKSLEKIIKSHNYSIENWEYYFVESSYPIKQCKLLEIRWNSNDDVRLLKTKSTLGYYLELRTIYLLKYLQNNLNHFMPFQNVEFLWDKNNNGHPGIVFTGFKIDENHFQLEIRYDFKNPLHYILTLREVSQPPLLISIEIQEKLKDFDFEDENEVWTLSNVHFNEIVNKLEIINTTIMPCILQAK